MLNFCHKKVIAMKKVKNTKAKNRQKSHERIQEREPDRLELIRKMEREERKKKEAAALQARQTVEIIAHQRKELQQLKQEAALNRFPVNNLVFFMISSHFGL